MPALVVEFIGLPGAGKTTIAQTAIEELTVAGYRCFSLSTLSEPESIEKRSGGFFSKLKTLYHFVLSCAGYRKFAANSLLFTINVRPLSLVNLRRFLILLVRLKSMRTLMESNYDLIILDQCRVEGHVGPAVHFEMGWGPHLVRNSLIRNPGTAILLRGTPNVILEGNHIET